MNYPAFAYATVLALQLRVMWRFWSGRDLSGGDSPGYYTQAHTWAIALKGAIFASPLYTFYFGAVARFVRTAPAASAGHRVLLALGVTTLVLAAARRLVPWSAAWIAAAWWAVLPINYDTYNEVHLFSILPALIAVLVLSRWNRWGGRAAVLAMFGTSAILVRNEWVFATVAFGAIVLWAAIGELREDRTRAALLRILRPSAAAFGVAVLVVAFFYVRSPFQFPVLTQIFHLRESLNFCQSFAANYQQRHPSWTGNPFTDCGPLITSVFGPGFVTFSRAAVRNFGAIAGYLAWNVRLIPSGLQLAMFGRTSGGVNPDYAPAQLHAPIALAGLIACAGLIVAGGFAIRRDRDLWTGWMRERLWPLAAMASTTAGGVIVMVQQRPRPSYFFSFTFTAIVAVSFCGFAVARRRGVDGLLSAAIPAVAVIALAIAPSHYAGRRTPMRDDYSRLQPASEVLMKASTVVPRYAHELCLYLNGPDQCGFIDYFASIRPQASASGSVEAALDRSGAQFVYADRTMLDDFYFSSISRASSRWRPIAGGEGWTLFQRTGLR